jgi:hypothetical protein
VARQTVQERNALREKYSLGGRFVAKWRELESDAAAAMFMRDLINQEGFPESTFDEDDGLREIRLEWPDGAVYVIVLPPHLP